MIKRTLFLVLISIQAALAMTPALLEKQAEKLILDKKVPKENLFYHYLLAARNLKKNQYYDYSIKYYGKALALPVEYNENRLRAMVELVHLLDEQQKYPDLKKALSDLERESKQQNYLKKNPDFQYLLDFYKIMAHQALTKDVIDKDYHHFKNTPYADAILDYEFKQRMTRGLFKEAYAMFTEKDYLIHSHDMRAAHDLLALVLGDKPQHWQCEESLKHFPNHKAYSIQLCRIIKDKRNKIAKAYEINQILSLLASKELDASHFIPAVKKLL